MTYNHIFQFINWDHMVSDHHLIIFCHNGVACGEIISYILVNIILFI